METNTIKKIETNNKRELVNAYNTFVAELINRVNGNEYYKLTNNPGLELTEMDLKDAGSKKIKRFKRFLNLAISSGSINSINKLFNLVHKRILEQPTSPKLVCEKHDMIQKLRKEWKKYQSIADQILVTYKKEKGNFYKENVKF